VDLLAFGLGHTAVMDGVSAADAVSIAQYVGGGVYGLFFVSSVLLAATAAPAHWPAAVPRRAAGRGVTATG
jgi:hypothetical protein